VYHRGIIERGADRILRAADHVEEGVPGRGRRFINDRILARPDIEEEVRADADGRESERGEPEAELAAGRRERRAGGEPFREVAKSC